MKILLINNCHYRKGGSETVYFNTADILIKHGHEVVFFSVNRKENIPCYQSRYFVKSNDDIPKWKAVLSYFYNLEAKRKLTELIKSEKPDIAHVHLFWGGISPSIFSVLHKYHIPIVHTAHDYRMVCPSYTFKNNKGDVCEACKGKYFFKCALKRCSKGSMVESVIMSVEMYFRNIFFNPAKNFEGIIYVSNFSKEKHFEHAPKLAHVKSLVLYNYTPKYDHGYISSINKGYFLFFGRISYEKGVRTLIKAFEKLSDIKLKIVGSGPEEDELKEYIKQRRINNIDFLGYKSGEELKKVISQALFTIVPSEWYENNPMTIVEAYSIGVPVIGSNIGGIPEIIEEGKNGFLFTPKSADGLAAAVIHADRLSEEKYKQMSDNALMFAEKNFSPEGYYEKLINFYKNVIS